MYFLVVYVYKRLCFENHYISKYIVKLNRVIYSISSTHTHWWSAVYKYPNHKNSKNEIEERTKNREWEKKKTGQNEAMIGKTKFASMNDKIDKMMHKNKMSDQTKSTSNHHYGI